MASPTASPKALFIVWPSLKPFRWLVVGAGLLASVALGQADAGAPMARVGGQRRCLRRVARVVGWQATELAPLVGGAGPQAKVREWLAPTFSANRARTDIWTQNGFARAYASFYAGKVNRQSPTNPNEAVYTFAANYVLSRDLPWADLFTRKMHCSVAEGCGDDDKQPAIGIFASSDWNQLYAGAAPDGAMLRGAANLLKAMVGLSLVPSAANMMGDNGATGRHREECRGCHFDSPWALDHITGLFYWKKAPDRQAVTRQTPTAQTLLNGRTYANLEGFVADVAGSETFRAWNCQLLFEYAYGRPPRSCEAATYDACLTSLRQTGRLRDALALIVEDPAFCAEQP